MVDPAGIEPASKESESSILSIKLWVPKRSDPYPIGTSLEDPLS